MTTALERLHAQSSPNEFLHDTEASERDTVNAVLEGVRCMLERMEINASDGPYNGALRNALVALKRGEWQR